MVRGPDAYSYRRDTISFLLCVLLAVTALFIPQSLGDTIAGGIRRTVLVPFIWMQRSAEQGRTSRARFEAVAGERDSIALVAQDYRALLAENASLRSLLALGRRITLDHVPAEVLHQPIPSDGLTLLLSAGSNRGVSVFDPVVSADGLVGVISSVQEEFSVAMTWLHPEFRVSAFARDTSVFGIVAAAPGGFDADGLLELRGVPYRDSIAAGTAVVASGLGGVFPRGLPIGTILGVSREERGWQRSYMVLPASNPATVRHVMILTGREEIPLTGVFETDTLP
ncbi:MAG: rod shape-determining protein MreC [Gemmatimonadales bacterium]